MSMSVKKKKMDVWILGPNDVDLHIIMALCKMFY